MPLNDYLNYLHNTQCPVCKKSTAICFNIKQCCPVGRKCPGCQYIHEHNILSNNSLRFIPPDISVISMLEDKIINISLGKITLQKARDKGTRLPPEAILDLNANILIDDQTSNFIDFLREEFIILYSLEDSTDSNMWGVNYTNIRPGKQVKWDRVLSEPSQYHADIILKKDSDIKGNISLWDDGKTYYLDGEGEKHKVWDFYNAQRQSLVGYVGSVIVNLTPSVHFNFHIHQSSMMPSATRTYSKGHNRDIIGVIVKYKDILLHDPCSPLAGLMQSFKQIKTLWETDIAVNNLELQQVPVPIDGTLIYSMNEKLGWTWRRKT